jgi:two-component system chemotaxis sensor kinase CheA
VDRDQLIQRLMVTFREELAEHVATLNRELMALEKESDSSRRGEILQTLFRTAHSLKGAARSVNVGMIERACHQLEEILGAAREGSILPGPEHFALLFETTDAAEEAGARLREGKDLGGSPLAVLLPRLEDAAGRVPAPPPSAPPLVTAPSRLPHSAGPAGGAAAAAADRQEAGPQPAPVLHPQTDATSHPAPPPSPLPDGGTVRVAAEKLDALLARDGELLVARRRVESRAEDVAALHEIVRELTEEWKTSERPLRKWLEKCRSVTGDSPPRGDGGERGPDGRVPRRVAALLSQTGPSLRRLGKDLDRLAATMSADHRQLNQVADALDVELRRARMIPFADACQGLDRVVHDLAGAGGKEAAIAIEGGDVELDRSVLEALRDPLRHLVRNAVDHGVETPDERRSAGKPAASRVTVTAVLRGSQVEVAVTDDGRGMDSELLRQTRRRKGLSEAADDNELMRSVFMPGFSTARLITDVSGRGVGLDVVRSRAEALHGTVEVSSVRGKGTRFILAVPLTLTTLRAVLVRAGGQTFALAGTSVRKLVRVGPNDLVSVAGRQMLASGKAPIPIALLAETLGLREREVFRATDKRLAVVVGSGIRPDRRGPGFGALPRTAGRPGDGAGVGARPGARRRGRRRRLPCEERLRPAKTPGNDRPTRLIRAGRCQTRQAADRNYAAHPRRR